jgi:3',5'-cyclic AMP phosphodiesterase CpdA
MQRRSDYITALIVAVLCAVLAYPAFAEFTFVQISDTHTDANSTDRAVSSRYSEVIKRVNALNPAFVIHTGDALASFSPESLALFKKISEGLKPKLYLVPGNHDAGNKLGQTGPITEQTYNAWVNGYGCGHVTFEHDGCAFIGLTSSLLNSGLAPAREQYDWLKAQLKNAGGKRIFVFMHHAAFETSPTEAATYFDIDEPARSELLKLFKKHHVEAVLYGHIHRNNESFFDGISFVGTASTAFSVVDDKGMTGYRVFHVSRHGFTTTFEDLRSGGEPPRFE